MKTAKIIRAAGFIAAGIVILLFFKTLTEYAGYVVGGVVLWYALEELVRCGIEKKLFKEEGSLFEDVVQLVIGVLLILVAKDIVKVCLIWGVWSIIRESREMAGAIKNVFNKKPGIINAVESVVVIVLSASMILEPGHHHAMVHMALLGIELILEIVFEAIEVLYERKEAEREEKALSYESLAAKVTEKMEEVALTENAEEEAKNGKE